MTEISENEFTRICQGIFDDRESICRNNPIGAPEEVLLWMVLGCLVSYLSLTEIETPCFNGKPDANTYQKAIVFVLQNRMESKFDPEIYLNKLTGKL